MALIDFAIVAALTEEFKHLRRLFPDAKEVPGRFTWYRTRTKSRDGKNYEIVLAHQNQMGPLDAQLLAQAVIERWDPAHLLLIGIAGSFHENVRLGDVIVSQQVFYFDPGKAAEGGLQYRPEGYPCSVSLIRQVHAVVVNSEEIGAWRRAAALSAAKKLRKLKTKIPNERRRQSAEKVLRAHQPSVHVGTLASGSLVIADPKKKSELLELHGKLLGTEMEGAGLLHAAFFHGESPKSAIVIKGVSDSADRNKSQLDGIEFWRELAGENSVRLALAVIERGNLAPTLADQFELDLTLAAPAEVRAVIQTPVTAGAAFLGFATLVRPKGPLSALSLNAISTAQGKPVSVSEAKILYCSNGKTAEHTLPAGHSIVFDTDEPIDSYPIGLYILTREAPDKIVIKVRSAGEEMAGECTL